MELVAGVLVLAVFHGYLRVDEVIRFKDVQRPERAGSLLKNVLGFPCFHKLDHGTVGRQNENIRRAAILDGGIRYAGPQAGRVRGVLRHGRNQSGQTGQYHYY